MIYRKINDFSIEELATCKFRRKAWAGYPGFLSVDKKERFIIDKDSHEACTFELHDLKAEDWYIDEEKKKYVWYVLRDDETGNVHVASHSLKTALKVAKGCTLLETIEREY